MTKDLEAESQEDETMRTHEETRRSRSALSVGGPKESSRRHSPGFTLVEVTIILVVLVILTTITLPQLGNFNRLARFTKAREDLTSLCAVAKTMLDATWLGAFYDDPAGDTWSVGPTDPVGMLAGPGDIPLNGLIPKGDAQHNITGDGWYEDDFLTFPCLTATPDGGGPAVDFSCDEVDFHLMSNDPHLGFPYPNPLDDPRPAGYESRDVVSTFFGWRGPYLDEMTTDPWGNRMMINTFALYGLEGLLTSPIICYSAGADRGVDTAFNQPSTSPFTVGGDDLIVVLSASGPM